MDYNTKTKMSSLLLPSRSRCKQLEGFLTANRQSCTNTDLYLSKFVKEIVLQICICNRILRSQLIIILGYSCTNVFPGLWFCTNFFQVVR